MIFHNKKNTLINVEWQMFRGGFLHIGRSNWVTLQRFVVKGQAFLGTEKEFIARAELAVDHEPKYSWFTLELVNLFEARWIYLWFRIWPKHNVKFVLNLGWRLTRQSRDYLERKVMEHERKLMHDMRMAEKAKHNNGGKFNASIIR